MATLPIFRCQMHELLTTCYMGSVLTLFYTPSSDKHVNRNIPTTLAHLVYFA